MVLATTIYNLPSAVRTTSSNSGDLTASSYLELAVDADITAASGTLQLFVDRKGADGIYYPIWQSSTITTTTLVSTSIGAGMSTAQGFGGTIRFRWVISGTFTFSASIIAK